MERSSRFARQDVCEQPNACKKKKNTDRELEKRIKSPSHKKIA